MNVALWSAAIAMTVLYALLVSLSPELAHALGSGFAFLLVLAWVALIVDLVVEDMNDRPDR